MTPAVDDDLWWKNAIVYCLDVETFSDSNGDGIGDLEGLIDHLDHVADLGATCLWLMPFYPTPGKDDGYDITDFYAVDPRLGSLGDVVVLVRSAKSRGLRVIVDLVVNHTSDQHPWFRSARASRSSPYRDFYVWVDEVPDGPAPEVVFPDAEDSVWTWDERAGQHYLHHFYSHQPDLNLGNPAVREEIAKIAGFWLELGVDGFRVDAVPYLVESGDRGGPHLEPHLTLKELRSFVARRKGDAVMLGEVNLPPEQLVEYFGGEPGDELQLLFDFPLMQRTYLAFARCDARPIAEALSARPPIPREAQWANFLRNHDELTLDQLGDTERQEVFDAFGPDDDMQLFGRGLRRRLPPMFQGDGDRIRMAYSLMCSLPGAPVLFYGEEIGMGENLDVEGRLSVRTPMQWTGDETGGFSTARPSKLRRRPPEGRFGPLAVNVSDQRHEDGSLLRWMERLLRCRRTTPEIGFGELDVLDVGADAVLAHRMTGDRRSVLLLHNLSPEPRRVVVPMRPGDGVVTDLLDDGGATLDPGGSEERPHLEVTLGTYGCRWLSVSPRDRADATTSRR